MLVLTEWLVVNSFEGAKMASYSWKSGISGDWSNAADWLGGAPNSADAMVTIAQAGIRSS
jgi:hypothetical protein